MHDLNRYYYPLLDSLWHPISDLKDYVRDSAALVAF